MADVREMLAWLNPANIKFDVGRGGIPQLTPQDVAAALAFVEPGLGREVFARLWWPDGAALSPHELDRQISNLVHAEAQKRHQRVQEIRSQLHQVEEERHRRRCSTPELRDRVAQLDRELAAARARLWPYQPEVHVLIREAVLDELAHPCLCPACGGRGTVMDDNLVVVCVACEGARVMPMSDRARAAKIGRDDSTFRHHWKGLYLWLLLRLRDAEAEAAAQFAHALRGEDRAA